MDPTVNQIYKKGILQFMHLILYIDNPNLPYLHIFVGIHFVGEMNVW